MDVKSEKITLTIYLNNDRNGRPSYVAPLDDRSQIDEFFEEMNDTSKPVMELGEIFFSKKEFKKAYLKIKPVK